MKKILVPAAVVTAAFLTAQTEKDSTKQKEIAEITLVGRKPTVETKVDRTVFNVANSSILSGNTTWEVLRMTPLVSIDSNDVIKAEGESVTVYINDRKSVFTGKDLKEYLKTIPAENLMKIEVITTPSSKYETSGEVINIVLKKMDNEGLKGSTTFSNTQSTKNSQYVNTNLNYHKNRFTQTLTGSYSNNTTRSSNISESHIFENNLTSLIDTQTQYYTRTPSLSASSELELNEKNTVGLVMEYSYNKTDRNTDVLRSDYLNSQLNESYADRQSGGGTDQNFGGNLFYKYYDKINNKILDLNAGVNYSGKNDLTTYSSMALPSSALTAYQIQNISQNREYYLKADYSQPLGAKGNMLEFGGKINFQNNTLPYDYLGSVNNQFISDPSRSGTYRYEENVNAVYANFAKTFFKKLETRIGLRYEHITYTVSQSLGSIEKKNSYGTLLPDVLLKYSFNDNYTLTAAYKHNIWRPYYSEFNPFTFPSEEGVFYRGNVDLQPNPSDRYSLKLGLYKKYFLSASYSYSDRDYWRSYYYEDGKTISMPTNFNGKSLRYSLNFNTNQTFFSNKMNVNLNLGADYVDNSDFNRKNNLDRKDYFTNLNGSANISYTNLFGKNINLNGWVGAYGQNYGNSDGNSINVFHTISATKIFEALQMEATVRASNIFAKPSFDTTTYTPIGTFRNINTFDWYGISFSLVKRFGNQKVKENSKTTVEKETGSAK